MGRKGAHPRVNWADVEVEFLNGDGIIKALADRRGIKAATIRAYAKRHEWQRKRHALQRDVTQAAQAKLTRSRTDELAEFNAADLKLARAFRSQIVGHLMRATERNMAPGDIKALVGAAEAAQRIGRIALGANDSPVEAAEDQRAKLRAYAAEMDRATHADG